MTLKSHTIEKKKDTHNQTWEWEDSSAHLPINQPLHVLVAFPHHGHEAVQILASEVLVADPDGGTFELHDPKTLNHGGEDVFAVLTSNVRENPDGSRVTFAHVYDRVLGVPHAHRELPLKAASQAMAS